MLHLLSVLCGGDAQGLLERAGEVGGVEETALHGDIADGHVGVGVE